MKSTPVRILAAVLWSLPILLHAQTWQGGSGGNVFNVGANWVGGSVPSTNGSLVFNTTTNTSVGFNTLPYIANSLTFTSAATNQFFINGNGGTLTLNSGITTQTGSGGANFSNGVNIALGADQTWTTASTVTINGALSGGFGLTKAGSGNLILSGANSYTGGTTVSAGALYLGNTNSSSGTFAIGSSGTVGGAFGDVTLGNAVSLASGATLGGSVNGGGSSVALTGAVTVTDPTATINVGAGSDVFFKGTIGAANSTALTFHSGGTGVAIMGTTSQTNITSITADNTAVAFGNTAALPDTQIQATNGGYVSIANVGLTTPALSDIVNRITDKANFNGVIGFDTDDSAVHPTVYSDNINLAGFSDGNVRLGSITSATLTGTITPVGQSYDFGGFAAQDGLLAVKSNLGQLNSTTTSVSVVSPVASGGAAQNGMVLALMGTNTFSGNITVSNSSVLLDSAVSGTTNLVLGSNSYAGYTENAGFADFAAFAARVANGGYTATSILGVDSHGPVDFYVNSNGTGTTRTVSDAIDLSGFSSIYLGSHTGATLSGAITAPTDGTIRLVNMSGDSNFVITSVLSQSNGLVAGMTGSEGAVVLRADNGYTGGTALNGGRLLAGNGTTSAFGNGTITVAATGTNGDMSALGTESGSASIANNISVGDNLQIGTGTNDNGTYTAGASSITLSGVISGASGRLYLTGPTTLSGANTYGGGTYVEADTTVTNNSALGTGFVDLGYNSTLTVDTAHLTIGSLANAGNFIANAGTGNINFTSNALDLTINQTSNLVYSGQFTGTAANLIKTGGAQLTLTGANGSSVASTSIVGGSLAIGDGNTSGVTFGGNVNISVTGANTGLFLRPAGAQTLSYNGNISGAGNVTVNGAGGGTVSITGGASNFTGSTTVAAGTLRITGDNYWSSASATTVNGGATLRLDGDQTLKNLSGGGTVNLATLGKTLTVDSVANTSFTGTITGSGALTKAGSGTFTVSGTDNFTGNTTVAAGTMVINSSFTSPTITVNSGASLLGTGTLNNLVVNGTYSPGPANAAGSVTLDSLTLGSTGLLKMELGGTGSYDFLNIVSTTGGTGAFTAGGTLQVSFINSFNPVSGNTFNLFDFTSSSGTFATLNLQTLTGGLSWDTSALYTTGVLSVTGTAVPEPSTTAALVGLAALSLAAWRRRHLRRVTVTKVL